MALPSRMLGIFVPGESDTWGPSWLAPSLLGRDLVLEPNERLRLELDIGEASAWLTGGEKPRGLWNLSMGADRFSTEFIWETSRLLVTTERLVWMRQVADHVWQLGHMRFEWIDLVEWSDRKLGVNAWLSDPETDGASDLSLIFELIDASAAASVGRWLGSIVHDYRCARVATLGVKPPRAWRVSPQPQRDGAASVMDLRGAAPLGGFFVPEKRKQLGAMTSGTPEGFPDRPLLAAGQERSALPSGVTPWAASSPPKRTDGRLVRGPTFTPVTLCNHDDPATGVYPRTCADGDRIVREPGDGDIWTRYRLRGLEVNEIGAGGGARIDLPGTLIATAHRLAVAFPGQAKALRAAMAQDGDLDRLWGWSLTLDLMLDLSRARRAHRDERNSVLAGCVPYAAITSLALATKVSDLLTIGFSESLTSPGWPRELYVSVRLGEGEGAVAVTQIARAIARQRLQIEGLTPTDRRTLDATASSEHDIAVPPRYQFPGQQPISDSVTP